MSANLQPITSDGGFSTTGNIIVGDDNAKIVISSGALEYQGASPAPSINGFTSAQFAEDLISSNISLVNGYIKGGIPTVVDDGINAIYTGAITTMDVFGFPFSGGGIRGQLTISGDITPVEALGTWYYESLNTTTYKIFTDSTYTVPVDSTSWAAYSGGGTVAITKLAPAANVIIDSNGYLTKFDNTGNVTFSNSISVSSDILAQNIRTIEGTVHVGQGAGLTNQGTYAIAMGRFAGSQNQSGAALAIGQLAGQTSQGQSAIALGLYAAGNTQSANAVAIGTYAGQITQGENAVAIGVLAGNNTQGGSSVAIGGEAGSNAQGVNSVAVGVGSALRAQGNAATALGAFAGQYDQSDFGIAVGSGAAYNGQGTGAIAIGVDASPQSQGDYSIAIGAGASTNTIQPNNSIIIDATSNSVEATGAGLFIAPVRNDVGNIGNIAMYNTTTKEVTYANTISVAGNVSGGNIIGNGSTLSNVATKTTGSWSLATGVNTVSISVPGPGTYSLWVNGNIPNGIITYTATAVVTNNNVPVLGSQYGWYYAAGGNLVLTSIPAQIVGNAGSISTATYSTTTANVFTFGITNNSGSTQSVDWGYTKL